MSDDPKILIVDDHVDTLFALESTLAPLGYEMISASSGEEALKVILRDEVGLVLLDLRMPGVSGLEVVRYMRHLEQTRGIPIILITAFGIRQDVFAEAFRLGVADVVMKPIEPLTLRTKAHYLYGMYQQLRSLQREVADLRAHLALTHPPEKRI
ncbi:two-component system response regulator [Streptomyces sp. NPDC050658]|uniref:response regulator n=1 Tax=unclassified Streptomyces TaxID=2593676 RepID=UPI0034361009